MPCSPIRQANHQTSNEDTKGKGRAAIIGFGDELSATWAPIKAEKTARAITEAEVTLSQRDATNHPVLLQHPRPTHQSRACDGGPPKERSLMFIFSHLTDRPALFRTLVQPRDKICTITRDNSVSGSSGMSTHRHAT